jgi:hypothetical protein
MSCCWAFDGFSTGFSIMTAGFGDGFLTVFGADFDVFPGSGFFGAFFDEGFEAGLIADFTVIFDVFTVFALTEAFFDAGFFTCLTGLLTAFFDTSFFINNTSSERCFVHYTYNI